MSEEHNSLVEGLTVINLGSWGCQQKVIMIYSVEFNIKNFKSLISQKNIKKEKSSPHYSLLQGTMTSTPYSGL